MWNATALMWRHGHFCDAMMKYQDSLSTLMGSLCGEAAVKEASQHSWPVVQYTLLCQKVT